MISYQSLLLNTIVITMVFLRPDHNCSTSYILSITILFLQLALIVAQSRDHNGVLSPINLTALSDGLRRIALQAKKMKG